MIVVQWSAQLLDSSGLTIALLICINYLCHDATFLQWMLGLMFVVCRERIIWGFLALNNRKVSLSLPDGTIRFDVRRHERGGRRRKKGRWHTLSSFPIRSVSDWHMRYQQVIVSFNKFSTLFPHVIADRFKAYSPGPACPAISHDNGQFVWMVKKKKKKKWDKQSALIIEFNGNRPHHYRHKLLYYHICSTVQML